MTSLAEVIGALAPTGDGGWRAMVPEGWLQGRTAYGGLSAALALHAAKATEGDLPPLRSMHVAFVGPVSGEATARARLLRRGRNAAFVEAEVSGEAGVGARATLVFMTARESAVDFIADPGPVPPTPGDDDPRLPTPPQVAFFGNFEMVALPPEHPAEWRRWARLRERDGLDPEVELAALADALPPAALVLLGRPAAVSSLTWQMDVVGPLDTRDGWRLLTTTGEHAHAGFSSQRMSIRDADGAAVAAQMQAVGVFA